MIVRPMVADNPDPDVGSRHRLRRLDRHPFRLSLVGSASRMPGRAAPERRISAALPTDAFRPNPRLGWHAAAPALANPPWDTSAVAIARSTRFDSFRPFAGIFRVSIWSIGADNGEPPAGSVTTADRPLRFSDPVVPPATAGRVRGQFRHPGRPVKSVSRCKLRARSDRPRPRFHRPALGFAAMMWTAGQAPTVAGQRDFAGDADFDPS